MSRKKRSYVRARRVTKTYMYKRGPQKVYRKGTYRSNTTRRDYWGRVTSIFRGT